MSVSVHRISLFCAHLALAASLALDPRVTLADDTATTAEASAAKAAATEQRDAPKAPSSAYVIEQNEQSQVAKRQVPGGWREVNVKGVVRWCQASQEIGTRTRREMRCITPEQFDQMERDAKESVDDIRRQQVPPKGG